MVVALSENEWRFVLVYIEPIELVSHSLVKDMENVRNVLTLLSKAAVTPKLKRCSIFMGTIAYCGHVIHLRSLEIALHMTDAMQKLKALRNMTELKSFSGLCNVSRWFVPNFARTASLAYDKL